MPKLYNGVSGCLTPAGILSPHPWLLFHRNSIIFSFGILINRFSTSSDRIRPLEVQFLTKLANSSVDPICLFDTWPKLLVRHLPKYEAKAYVADLTLEKIGRTGI